MQLNTKAHYSVFLMPISNTNAKCLLISEISTHFYTKIMSYMVWWRFYKTILLVFEITPWFLEMAFRHFFSNRGENTYRKSLPLIMVIKAVNLFYLAMQTSTECSVSKLNCFIRADALVSCSLFHQQMF